MRGKLLFVTGAAIGYVLGARAGRKRYEQIADAASRVWQSPGIQKQVQQAQDFAAEKVGEVPGAVIDGVKKVVAAKSKRKRQEPSGEASAAGGSAGGGSAGSGSAGSGSAARTAARIESRDDTTVTGEDSTAEDDDGTVVSAARIRTKRAKKSTASGSSEAR
ncbi:MAG: hypothetical protein ABI255_08390 [Microbacteriaceae bacterium]